MTVDVNKLIMSIKEQVQMFLLDAGEFYPFGCCIDKTNKIKPIGVYLENENPSSSEVISILEKTIRTGIQNREYLIGIIIIDVIIKEDDVDHDAIELRFFEANAEYKKHIKYQTYGTHIEFK